MSNTTLSPEQISSISNIDMNKVRQAITFITSSKDLTSSQQSTLLNEPWRVNFRSRPPTPEEFLTVRYIGPVAENIYPRIKQCFMEFFDENQPYRHAVLGPFIGFGKTLLSNLIMLYITVHLAMMKNPKKYFGLSSHTTLAFVLASFNLAKSSELLREPIQNILESSEFFERCRTKEDMVRKEREFQRQSGEITKIYWTTASPGGIFAFQFSGNLVYKLVSSTHNLLGLTIVAGTMSELSFWVQAGRPEEEIMRFYFDLRGRIWSRLKGDWYGRSILDSSPNSLENPVDQFVQFESKKDETNYVVTGSHYSWVESDYLEEELADRFPIFKGSSGKPPMILSSAEGYNPVDIEWVPRRQKGVDLEGIYRSDLYKALKDISGIPQGNLDRLFYDYEKIEQCFIPQLKSLYYPIRADSKMSPFGLIWNQIKDTFFVKSGHGYKFYYKPSIPRVFHIDQSITGDTTAIAMVHVERKEQVMGRQFDANRDLVYVVDFCIEVHPFGGRINLDAIKEFVIDLYTQGGVSIVQGSYDTFQSEAAIQYLERNGLEMERVSVDETMDPYLFLSQLIEQGNLKTGRDIFFKNNLKSLRIVPTKISKKLKVDHSMGDTINPQGADYTWETSLIGINAKDASDAIAGAIYNAKMFLANDGRCLSQVFDSSNIVITPEKVQAKVMGSLKEMGFILPTG